MSDEQVTTSPTSSHLGTSWEIAVICVVVAVLFAVIGAAVFHIRRKRRRRNQNLHSDLAEKFDLPNQRSDLTTSTVLASPQRTATSPYHKGSSSTRNDSPTLQPTRYYWNLPNINQDSHA